MACDDTCNLDLSLTDPADPDAKERILQRDEWVSFRDFYKQDNVVAEENEEIGVRFSNWI